ncbi:hypothetical protein [Polluticaenibacter yanchengensis]|uniref:YcxB-like protein domain-containing protein n=1 Tax=Polluticaenibacter yanchengensis TaxID=3014562 RepID=A0ABT4UJP6_9BACT|nr:hypothetical protein [Chitinophagaceae bacterium LY-5]
MKLKNIIRFIEYSYILLFFGIIILALALANQSKEGAFFFFQLILGGLAVIFYFIRLYIINYFIRRTPYPGVLYDVLDRTNLSNNISFELSEELMTEVYKPAYSTEEFLNNNDLESKIGYKKAGFPYIIVTLCIAFLIYFSYKRAHIDWWYNALLIITILHSIYKWQKNKKQPTSANIVMSFTEEGLLYYNTLITWKSIYDWKFTTEQKNMIGFNIEYYDVNQNNTTFFADTTNLDINRFEFLLLLSHYKSKYG